MLSLPRQSGFRFLSHAIPRSTAHISSWRPDTLDSTSRSSTACVCTTDPDSSGCTARNGRKRARAAAEPAHVRLRPVAAHSPDWRSSVRSFYASLLRSLRWQRCRWIGWRHCRPLSSDAVVLLRQDAVPSHRAAWWWSLICSTERLPHSVCAEFAWGGWAFLGRLRFSLCVGVV